MSKRGNGRVVYLAPEPARGTRELAAFLAQRTGNCLSAFQEEQDQAFAGAPLGPGTQLSVLSMGGLSPNVLRRIICISPCPVLAVPGSAEKAWAAADAHRRHPQTILCGSDGSAQAKVAEEHAAQLAEACGARLLVTEVRPTRDGPVARCLSRIARDERALLIAVGSDCIDPSQLEASGSQTGALLAASSTPVLIVPPWAKLPPPRTERRAEPRPVPRIHNPVPAVETGSISF